MRQSKKQGNPGWFCGFVRGRGNVCTKEMWKTRRKERFRTSETRLMALETFSFGILRSRLLSLFSQSRKSSILRPVTLKFINAALLMPPVFYWRAETGRLQSHIWNDRNPFLVTWRMPFWFRETFVQFQFQREKKKLTIRSVARQKGNISEFESSFISVRACFPKKLFLSRSIRWKKETICFN